MPQLPLDQFDNAALWQAVDAANAPSGELALALEPDPHPHAADPNALRVDITGAATGHRIRRGLGPVDLTPFDRLTLWVRPDVVMRGKPDDPLRLRIRLGSAALPVGAVGNEWHRYLTAPVTGRWSYQSLDLADLAPAVRGAVDTIEIDVTSTLTAHAVRFDGMEARRSAPVADADTGLLALLSDVLQLGGAPVSARLAPDAAAEPYIRLLQYNSLWGRRRSTSATITTDQTDTGSSQRPAPVPWDIFYRAEFIAATRAEQAAMLDFVIDRVGRSGWLALGNQAVRIDPLDAVEPDDGLRSDPVFRFRVSTWAEPASSGLPTIPVSEIVVSTDAVEA